MTKTTDDKHDSIEALAIEPLRLRRLRSRFTAAELMHVGLATTVYAALRIYPGAEAFEPQGKIIAAICREWHKARRDELAQFKAANGEP